MRKKFTEQELERLNAFCKKNELKRCEFLAKGHSSRVFLVKKGRKKLVAKVERSDSSRDYMLEKEAFNLKLANSVRVGPKLFTYDFFYRVLVMNYVNGSTCRDWLLEENHRKKTVLSFAKSLLKQARKLDRIGLDHGQLAGRGTNILVKNKKPVIIDFEKASINRKCHNFNVVKNFLFKNKRAKICKKVRKTLGEKKVKKLLKEKK